VVCIGGTSIKKQMHVLRRKYSVVVGTLGRIKDLIQRKALPMHQFETVVLDEVDRMLDMGFIHDMRSILGKMPQKRQSYYFSATTTSRVEQLIGEFSQNVHRVSVKTTTTAAKVQQDVVLYKSKNHKITQLHDILSTQEVQKTVIFGRTKRGVRQLCRELLDNGHSAESIHGDKSQSQRQRALKDFRNNRVNVLVATDVASRGLDVDDITHVINYDIPESYDSYVHRIGRTGRANKSGQALTFVSTK
jgi:superfamily II DNA/RNA helicase